MAISSTRWKGKMPSFNQFLNESKKYDEDGLLLEGNELNEEEGDSELGDDMENTSTSKDNDSEYTDDEKELSCGGKDCFEENEGFGDDEGFGESLDDMFNF